MGVGGCSVKDGRLVGSPSSVEAKHGGMEHPQTRDLPARANSRANGRESWRGRWK